VGSRGCLSAVCAFDRLRRWRIDIDDVSTRWASIAAAKRRSGAADGGDYIADVIGKLPREFSVAGIGRNRVRQRQRKKGFLAQQRDRRERRRERDVELECRRRRFSERN